MTFLTAIWKGIAAVGRAVAAAFGFYPDLPEGVVRASASEPMTAGRAVFWDDHTPAPSRLPKTRRCPDMPSPVPPVESLTEPELDAMWAAIERDIAELDAAPMDPEERWLDAVCDLAAAHLRREPELWKTLGPVKAMLHAVLAELGLTETQRIVVARLVMRHRRLNRTAREIAERGDKKTIPTGRTSF